MRWVIWLQAPTAGQGTILIYLINDVRQTKIHTAEPLVPMLSAFEIEMAIEKLKILIKSQQNY